MNRVRSTPGYLPDDARHLKQMQRTDDAPHHEGLDPPVMLVGSSRLMRYALRFLRVLAPLSVSILLEGERGTGKTLAAQCVHRWSGRKGRFEELTVGGLAPGLEHDALQGHARGAFTGAESAVAGLFERAHGGTAFLDDVGEASLSVQVALLPLAEERPIRRLGDVRSVRVDTRIIAATNADLEALVRQGKFRRDLLDRFGFFRVSLPPLRRRRRDIPALAEHAIRSFCARQRLRQRVIAPADTKILLAYDWPGNVRELVNAMRYYAVVGVLPKEILAGRASRDWSRLPDAMRRHGNNVSAVAREFGVARPTIYRKLAASRSSEADKAAMEDDAKEVSGDT